MLLAFEFIFVPNAWSPESAEFTAGIIVSPYKKADLEYYYKVLDMNYAKMMPLLKIILKIVIPCKRVVF
jgi:hypothetical protein